jgi:hypothetical protein
MAVKVAAVNSEALSPASVNAEARHHATDIVGARTAVPWACPRGMTMLFVERYAVGAQAQRSHGLLARRDGQRRGQLVADVLVHGART